MKKVLLISALLCFLCPAVLSAQNKYRNMDGVYWSSVENSKGYEIHRMISLIVKGDNVYVQAITEYEGNPVGVIPHKLLPIEGGKVSYENTDSYGDKYKMTITLLPNDNAIRIVDDVDSEGGPLTVSLDGEYEWNGYTFVVDDYMYQYVSEGEEVDLCWGGVYEGTVKVPKAVSAGKDDIPVGGIARNSFWGNYKITSVERDPSQTVWPGTYMYTNIPYTASSFEPPIFVYPSDDLSTFASPRYLEGDDSGHLPWDQYHWLFFKQNYNEAIFQKFNSLSYEEGGKEGRADFDFEKTVGPHYLLVAWPYLAPQMFRGYSSLEIEALMVPSDFAAFHSFPSYSRWKYPEAEVSVGKAFERDIEGMYSRKVRYSRKVAALRDGSFDFVMAEFEPKDGEAKVMFFWRSGDEIIATCEMTTEVDEDDEYSIWNVDDDGTYGIPDVVSIALDRMGNVTLFIVHNSPESVDCMRLVQEGDKLIIHEQGQWYRYVD